ncbi:hypothetical protein N656DRAFT_572357 [Canariomyces notabilis]|uniref:Uncharacterized protein n=1 Tax=Canariomyces notabilis TaxID=2074819 RepID=A0AAN6YU50_9PEZI|nr:hypothetical protein N656DRAFT_572357 [Canariomyces arenarius]
MNCLYLYEVFSSRPLSQVLQDCSTCGRCRPETSRVRWAGCGVNCGHRNGQCTALSSQRFSPVDTLIPELLHLDLKLDLVSRKQSGDGLGQWSVSRLRPSDAGSSERCTHCPRSTGDKPFEINISVAERVAWTHTPFYVYQFQTEVATVPDRRSFQVRANQWTVDGTFPATQQEQSALPINLPPSSPFTLPRPSINLTQTFQRFFLTLNQFKYSEPAMCIGLHSFALDQRSTPT